MLLPLPQPKQFGPSHSDRIAREARDCLRRYPPFIHRDLVCECEDGVLYLRGEVLSFHEKQLAQEAVKRLEGVNGIINHIDVR